MLTYPLKTAKTHFYLSAIAGVLFLFTVMSKIPVIKVLKFFGENTLLLLATHYFILYGYRVIDKFLFNSKLMNESFVKSILLTVITLSFYYPLSIAFNKYLPFAIGIKKQA